MQVLTVFVLATCLVASANSASYPSCYPIGSSESNDYAAGNNCCSLGPFNSLCTAEEDSNVLLTSTAGGSSLVPDEAQSINSEVIPNLSSPSEVQFLSTMNETNKVAKIFTQVNGKLLTAVYTLQIFEAGDLTNIAIYGQISYNLRCTINQLVGAIGVAQKFEAATCVRVCLASGGHCSPFGYCALRHPTDPEKAWFGVTDRKNRLFDLHLVKVGDKPQAWFVALKGDCLGGEALGFSTGFYSIQQDPANNGYIAVVSAVTWKDGGTTRANYGSTTIMAWNPSDPPLDTASSSRERRPVLEVADK